MRNGARGTIVVVFLVAWPSVVRAEAPAVAKHPVAPASKPRLIRAKAMVGPVVPAKHCATIVAALKSNGDYNKEPCGGAVTRRTKVRGPYKAVQVRTIADHAILEVVTAKGSYLRKLHRVRTDDIDIPIGRVKSLSLRQVVPGGAPEIVIRTRVDHKSRTTHSEPFGHDQEHLLYVCGLGPGAPACVRFVEKWQALKPARLTEVSLRIRFDRKGRVVVTKRRKILGIEDYYLGHNRIVFP